MIFFLSKFSSLEIIVHSYLIVAYIIFYHCLASYHKIHYKASVLSLQLVLFQILWKKCFAVL